MEHDLTGGFRLGNWYVRPERNCIVSREKEHHLESKVMAVLVHLSERSGQVVSKAELMDRVWPQQAVADGVLTRAIYELRRALDDDASRPRYIQNVPRIGYRMLQQPQAEVAGIEEPTRITRRRIKTVSAALIFVIVSMLAVQLLHSHSGSPAIRSVAVLPFVNMTGDSEKNYVSDGLTEEVIHVLAQQPELSVSARTSSFALRGQELTVKEIGKRLDVDSVIEGSVRQERGVQRLTVQLIDTRSGAHRGSVTLDVIDGDLFAAQSRLAEITIGMLKDAGVDVRPLRIGSPVTDEIKVYELYLRGRAALQNRSTESLRAAREFLLEAVRLDDTFAPAHASLAQLHVVARTYLGIGIDETRRLATASLEKALAHDPVNVEALTVSAVLAAGAGDYEQGLQLFDRAILLQPSHAIAHLWRGEVLHSLGYLAAGKESIETALRLDPLAGSTNTVMAKALAFFPNEERMLSVAQRAESFDARLATKFLVLHHFRAGDLPSFERELTRYYDVLGIAREATQLIIRAAKNETYRDSLAQQLEPYTSRRNNYFARELALLGQHEAALDALRRWPSPEGSFVDDMWLPEFREVRTLPGFAGLVRQMGLDDYWLKHGPPDTCRLATPEPFCEIVAARAAD